MKKVNSARGAVIMSTEALFGSIISILAGADVLSWRIVLGGILITLSVALPNIRLDFTKYQHTLSALTSNNKSK